MSSITNITFTDSPPPGNVPQHKRGSSASLSHVEDSMFRSAQSSGSLTKFETQSLRSAVTTPDDSSVNDSPTRYSTMPTRGKMKQKKQTVVKLIILLVKLKQDVIKLIISRVKLKQAPVKLIILLVKLKQGVVKLIILLEIETGCCKTNI